MLKNVEPEMVMCAHRDNGRTKLCPKHWFNDPSLAGKIDWVPMEGKKFEDEIPTAVQEQILKEKQEADALKNEEPKENKDEKVKTKK